MDFFDTNVIVYANDRRDRDKHDIASRLVRNALADQSGAVSVQVLMEYANVALSKLKQRRDVVCGQLTCLSFLLVVRPRAETVRRAVEIGAAYQMSFWDAAIIAAAEEAGCSRILSEDLNAGQFYCGMRMVNPFSAG